MQNHSELPPIFAALVPLLLVAMWCGMLVLTAKFSGWASLAKRFRLDSPFTGVSWGWQSARMRWSCRYGNSLKVGADPSGIYLSVFFLLRVGHPPLLVPWPEVIIYRRRTIFFFSYVELRLGREEQIPFVISEGLANRLRGNALSNWPVEPVS